MLNIHSISLKGHRPTNEDKEIIFQNLNGKKTKHHKINLYAVFDGHGGSSVSEYLFKNFGNYFTPKSRINPITNEKKKYQKHIVDSYKHIQTKLKNEFKTLVSNTGAAACTILHFKKNKKNMLYVNNLGDCRAVLCNKFNIAIPLSKDHKPFNYEETVRIHKLGGKIIHEEGDDPRIEGLSVSRAFGDLDTKPYVSHIPEIFRYELDKRDKFIILGCDGLWDVFENQQAANFILHLLNNKNKKKVNFAEELGKEAIKRGSTDNVSIIIIMLN